MLPEGTQPHVIYTVLYKHTWVNVEFLHQAEHLFGEHFGLHQVLAVLGQREAREAAGKHGSTQRAWTASDVPIFQHKHTHTHLQIWCTLKLGWHHKSSMVTSSFSRWLWPVTKDSANGSLFCRISGTHICRRKGGERMKGIVLIRCTGSMTGDCKYWTSLIFQDQGRKIIILIPNTGNCLQPNQILDPRIKLKWSSECPECYTDN